MGLYDEGSTGVAKINYHFSKGTSGLVQVKTENDKLKMPKR